MTPLTGAILISFLSTLSLRRATADRYKMGIIRQISIHALLAESDPPRGGYCYLDNIISIHALLAESDVSIIELIEGGLVFLSTLSLRRATVFNLFANPGSTISIHALLAESDHNTRNNCIDCCISIHALLAESD